MSDKPTAQEYLKNKGLTGVGTYGLLCTRPDKSHMHELMEDYADEKVKPKKTELRLSINDILCRNSS